MPSVAATISALRALGQAGALAWSASQPWGVRNSYDAVTLSGGATAQPDKFNRAQIPCLFILPEVGIDQGFITSTMLGNAPGLTFAVSQIYIGAESAPANVASALPYQVAFLDAYNAYIKANPLLTIDMDGSGNPTYQTTFKYTVDMGILNFAEIDYHSIAFKHTFTIYL